MALSKVNISSDSENKFLDTNIGPFSTFGSLVSIEAGAGSPPKYPVLSLGNEKTGTNKNFFNDLDNALNLKLGDKTYGIFKQENRVYLIAIKDPKLTHLFTPIIRKDTEAFSGEGRKDGSGLLKTTVSEYNKRLPSGSAQKKLFFATNGPLFDRKIASEDRYSSSAASIMTHRVIGMVFSQSTTPPPITILRESIETDNDLRDDTPYTARTRYSPDGYYARFVYSNGEPEFGIGETNYKRGNPNNTADNTNNGTIRAGIGGLGPLLMTYSDSSTPKFTITFGLENKFKNGFSGPKTGGSHRDINFLRTLNEKSSAYWAQVEDNYWGLPIGYNFLAYHPAKNIALVVLQEHSKGGFAPYKWPYFADRLKDLGFEYAVAFDSSDSVFLYDYDLGQYVFQTGDKGKDFSTEMGYGFTV